MHSQPDEFLDFCELHAGRSLFLLVIDWTLFCIWTFLKAPNRCSELLTFGKELQPKKRWANWWQACVLRLSDNAQFKPRLEFYFLIPLANPETRRVFCFRSDDQNIPLDRSALRLDNHCTIEGPNYEVVETRGRPLDFMFEYSPVYAFLKSNLYSGTSLPTPKDGVYFLTEIIWTEHVHSSSWRHSVLTRNTPNWKPP